MSTVTTTVTSANANGVVTTQTTTEATAAAAAVPVVTASGGPTTLAEIRLNNLSEVMSQLEKVSRPLKERSSIYIDTLYTLPPRLCAAYARLAPSISLPFMNRLCVLYIHHFFSIFAHLLKTLFTLFSQDYIRTKKLPGLSVHVAHKGKEIFKDSIGVRDFETGK